MAFTLTSPEIAADSTIDRKFEFNGFGCSGENKSPALKWSGAPAGTKSYAVTLYDPDAPTGSGFWHWFVVNIPGSVTELASNAGATGGAHLPKGAKHVRIDYGISGFREGRELPDQDLAVAHAGFGARQTGKGRARRTGDGSR